MPDTAEHPWKLGFHNHLAGAEPGHPMTMPGGTVNLGQTPRLDFAALDWRDPTELPPPGGYVLALVRARAPAGRTPDYRLGLAIWQTARNYNWGDGADELDAMDPAEAVAKGYEILREPRHDDGFEDGGENVTLKAWGVRYQGWVFAGAGQTEDGETAHAPAPEFDFDLIAWAHPPARVPLFPCPAIADHQREDGFLPARFVAEETYLRRRANGDGWGNTPTHLIKLADGTLRLARRQRWMESFDGDDPIDPHWLTVALFDDRAPDADARVRQARLLVAAGYRDFYLYDDGDMIDLAAHPDFGWIELEAPSEAEGEALRALFRPDLPAPAAPDPDADPSDAFETALDLLENAASERGEQHLRCKRIDEARAALRALAGF